MYLLMAYINGEWGIAGFEPHQECAVNFISAIDEQYGDGTAFVCLLPDKEAEEAQKAGHTELSKMLTTLEQGSFDFDAALANLNKHSKHEE